MSIWKSPVFYVGLLLVALVGAALLAPFVVDWNAYRPQLEAYGHKISGRDVAIHGAVGVRLYPWPRLDVEDVVIGGPQAGDAPLLATQRATIHLALAGLFSGQIRVEAIDLVGPQLNLVLDKAGSGNWHLQPDKDVAASGLLANVLLEQINVADGQLTFTDLRHGKQRRWTAVNGVISGAAWQGPWRAKATARDGEMPVDASFSSAAWAEGQPLKFAFRVAAQDGALPALSFDGEGRGGTVTGKASLDPVITDDGRSSLSGGFKPLIYQSKIEIKEDMIKLSGIHIVAADPKDSGTLIEGDAIVDLSHSMKINANLKAPHVDLDRLAAAQALRIWQAGGLMQVLNGVIARFPEDLDLNVALGATALTAGGEKLENVDLKASAAQGAIRLQNFEADLPGRSRMKFDGIVFPGQDAAELGGSLAFETGDARAFAQWLWPEGKDMLAKTWTGARGHFKSQSDVNWGGKRFGFQNLRYELDGLQGKGEVAVTLGQLPAISLNVAADQFDLGSYVSGGIGGLLSQEGWANLVPSATSFEKRIDVNFGKFSMNGVEAEKVALNFNSSASGFEVKDFSIGTVEGAEVKGNGLVLVGPEGPTGDIKFAIGAQRPTGLMRLIGLLPPGPDPRWTSLLGATDLRADINVKPGAAEPEVSFSVTGASGPYQLVSSGTVEKLTQGQGASLGTSATLTSADARNLLRLFGLEPKGAAIGEGQLAVTANGNSAQGFTTVWDLQAQGLSAGFTGTLQPQAALLGLAGKMKLSADDGAALLQMLGFPVATGLAGTVEAGAEVAALPDGLALKALHFSGGKQELKGSGSLKAGGILALDLQGGSFRLADIVGVAAAAWNGEGAWPNGVFPAAWPFGLSGEIWLRPTALAEPLGAPLGEAVVGLSSDAGAQALSLVARAADGSPVTVDAALKPGSAGQVLTAQLRYPFLLRNIFSDGGKPTGLVGSAVLEGSFSGEGRSPGVLLANLTGNGSVTSADARISGIAPDAFYAAIQEAKSADEIQSAFASFTTGPGVALGQVRLPFTAKDGAVNFETAQTNSEQAQMALTPSIELATGVIAAAVKITSKAQPDLPAITITTQGLAGAMQTRIDTAALASKLGTALISKDMAALDKLQHEQEQAAQDAAAMTAQDKAKFEAFQSQRAELRLQQRMIKVFAQQRALDAARYKASVDAAIAEGLAVDKEEKKRLMQRVK